MLVFPRPDNTVIATIKSCIGDIRSRCDGEVVAGRYFHVLALYLYVARRSADGYSLEGIYGDISKGRLYAHLAVVRGTGDGVEPVLVSQFKTATQFVVVRGAPIVNITELCKV